MKKETVFKIEIKREIQTHSKSARLFVLRAQTVNGMHVRGGIEIWIPNSQITKSFLQGGDGDYINVKEWFYNKLKFV